jgi:dihydrofolate synthase / folylpolyglutamate synthase
MPPVSLDHAEKLGPTLGAIAGEKAGILKPGVTAIISSQADEAGDVIARTARRIGAPLVVWGQDFDAYAQSGRLIVQRADQLLDLPLPALLGRHQIVNAGTAVAAALELRDLGIDDAAIEKGLTSVRWPARLQRLDSGPLPASLKPGSELWLDGGHNPAAGEVLAQTLADLEERSPRPLHLVVGMMGLKDAAGFLRPFRGLARDLIAVPIPGANEAPHAPETLAEAARSVGLQAYVATDVPAALRAIDKNHPGAKRILICGSLYLAGQVLALQEGVIAQGN